MGLWHEDKLGAHGKGDCHSGLREDSPLESKLGKESKCRAFGEASQPCKGPGAVSEVAQGPGGDLRRPLILRKE